jgi:hypothetical protein
MAEIVFNDGVPGGSQDSAVTNWQHKGWRREATPAAQRDKLVLHIEEVEERITESTSGGGQSVSADALVQHRDYLQRELEKLERRIPGSMYGGGALHAGFDRR